MTKFVFNRIFNVDNFHIDQVALAKACKDKALLFVVYSVCLNFLIAFSFNIIWEYKYGAAAGIILFTYLNEYYLNPLFVYYRIWNNGDCLIDSPFETYNKYLLNQRSLTSKEMRKLILIKILLHPIPIVVLITFSYFFFMSLGIFVTMFCL